MLKLENLNVLLPNSFPLLKDVNITVPNGEVVTLFGPSGCGKSTLLNVISGFINLDNQTQGSQLIKPQKRWFRVQSNLTGSGKVYLDNIDITSQKPEVRPISMVLQKFAVYPHMTAHENIAFPLVCQKTQREEIAKQVENYARQVGLPLRLLKKRVQLLSGGEAQRVAIAKMLAKKAKLGLMDEPFSHLDQLRRIELFKLMRFLVSTSQDSNLLSSLIVVSHDWREVQESDKVILLNAREDMKTMLRVFDVQKQEKKLNLIYSSSDEQIDDNEYKWIVGLSSALQ